MRPQMKTLLRTQPMSFPSLTGRDNDFLKLVLPAASRGKIDAVEQYLAEVPGFLQRVGPHGRTMLWEAARAGRLEMVRLLAARGADLEALGCYHRETWVELSPWCVATLRGHEATAAWLREAGARYDFITACYLGDEPAFDRMIAADPGLATRPVTREHRYNPYHATPLHYAIAGQQAGLLARLLDIGARPGEDGGLLLHWTFWAERTDLARPLLDLGARPRPGDQNEWVEDPAFAALAEEYGFAIDINAPNRLGFPAIVDACRGNHHAPDDPERVQEILARGGDPKVRDHKGKTALHRAAQAGFVAIPALLLEHGAELEAADAVGETPLFDAVRAGRVATVGWLLDAGANPLAENRRGQTPTALARRLRKAGADEIRSLLDRG